MNTKIQKWGNSLAIRIPKSFAKSAEIDEGSDVKLKLIEDRIIVEPERKHKKFALRRLLSKVSKNNIHSEVDTGNVTGKELW